MGWAGRPARANLAIAPAAGAPMFRAGVQILVNVATLTVRRRGKLL